MGNEVQGDIETKSGERQSLTPTATKNSKKFAASFDNAVLSSNKLYCNKYRAYKWEERPNPVNTAKSYYVCQGENDKINQFTDVWDIEDWDNPYVSMNRCLPNAIHLKPKDKKNKSWISVFGTKICTKNDYKRWRINILPNTKHKNKINKTVKIMIGIVDIQTITERESGKAIQCKFWCSPHFGYAFGAEKGKNTYCKKYKIGDTIHIELNRKSNGHTTHNELKCYTNDIVVDGTAFNVDIGRNYVLALALYDNNCQIQISD